jgi:hypothetical protein
MTSTYQLGLGGSPAPADFYDKVEQLEVEENADRADALLLRVPVNRTSKGDLVGVGDGTFEPYTNVTVTVTPPSHRAQCIFDGYMLSWKLHLDRTSGCSSLEVWAQDASWLMNVSDSVKEWPGLTDGQVANQIFGSYGFQTASGNTDDDSPVHKPDDHTLYQRATDLQFLRGLARRNGKLCRVACTDSPGKRTGYFVTPNVGADPAATISLVDPDTWTVDCLEFDWDVMRPFEVDGSQLPLDMSSKNGVAGNATKTGLAPLDERDFRTYAKLPKLPAGTPGTMVLTAAADVAEVKSRTTAALREAGWFVRCTGETDLDRLGDTLRVGTVVKLEGAGTLQSGKWFVWQVRHVIMTDSIKIKFTLVRNAVGPAPGGGGGLSLPGGL